MNSKQSDQQSDLIDDPNCNQPRIAFIGSDDPVNNFIFSKLSHSVNQVGRLKVQWCPGKRKKKTLLKRLVDYPGRITRQRLGKRRLQDIGTKLELQPEKILHEQSIASNKVNSRSAVKLLKDLDPDILLVCGAPILKKRVFEIPRIATINIHFGISSAYRGENTLFWPIMEGQFENIGATVHLIDQGVDTGEILLEYYPELTPSDDETTLELKIARGLIDPLTELFQSLKQSQSNELKLSGKPLGSTGKTIRNRDRRFLNTCLTELRKRTGLLVIPSAPSRVQTYYSTNVAVHG